MGVTGSGLWSERQAALSTAPFVLRQMTDACIP